MAVNFWELGYNGDWIPMSTDEAFEKKVAILGCIVCRYCGKTA